MSQPQTIHRVEPRVAEFDEQPWLVNVLLLVLAAFVGGMIAARADFHTPVLTQNGWFHLGVLAGVVLLLALSSGTWLGRAIQRPMQAAVLFSLLVHLWLAMGMKRYELPVVSKNQFDQVREEPLPVRLPDYHREGTDTSLPSEEFETPVPTAMPDLPKLETKRLEMSEVKITPRPVAEPKSIDRPQPKPLAIDRAEIAAPRREEPAPVLQKRPTEVASLPAREPLVERKPPAPARRPASKTNPDQLDVRSQPEKVAASPQPLGEPQPPRSAPQVTSDVPRVPRVERPTIDQLASTAPQRNVSAPAPALPLTAPAGTAPRGRPDAGQPMQPAASDIRRQAAGRLPGGQPIAAPADDGARLAPGGASSLPGSSIPRRQVSGKPDLPPGDTAPLLARSGVGGPSDMPALPVIGPSAAAGPRGAAQAGSEQPGSLETTAGGTLPRQAALVPAGPMTGLVGDGSIDLGPGPRTSAAGQGRAIAGGEPSVSVTARPLGKTSAGDASAPTSVVGLGGGVPGPSAGVAGTARPGPGDNLDSVGPIGRGAVGGGSGGLGSATGSGGVGPGFGRGIGGPGLRPGDIGVPDGDPTGGAASSGAGGDMSGGPRRVGGNSSGPSIGDVATTGPPGRRGTVGIPGGVDFGAPAPLASGGNPAGAGPAAARSPSMGDPAGDLGPRPREALSLPMRGAAGAGPGGFGDGPLPDVGQPSRRVRSGTDMVRTDTARPNLQKASSGQPTVDAHVRDTAVYGFKQRDRESRGAIAKSRGGTPGTEQAVEAGLDFLARHQSSSGNWSLHAFAAGRDYPNAGAGEMHSDTAGTGLALLSFLGAGYTHTDGKYRDAVRRGLDFLLAGQKPDGDLFRPEDTQSNLNAWLYSHGIASIAMCEAYGLTRDERLRGPAQRALNFIAAAQSPEEGGWRYSPRRGSDTSVSGWQVMALKSGELAGLSIPPQCYAGVTHWLDYAQGAGGNPSRYAYLPRSPQPQQSEPSRVMTAEALLLRQYMGWRRDNPNMIDGAIWLAENPPSFGVPTRENPAGQRDAYYWYYATQVMFQMQGDHWKAWNDRLRPMLLNSQVTSGALAGSWDPNTPVPDRWGHYGGRIYVTALHLLMLEVYYRHLPIYQTLD